MPISELFLLALLVIFALPWLVWRLGRTDGWAPLVVVQIVAGVLLGPGIFGAVAPELHGQLFQRDVLMMLSGIAMWAVMIFVWSAGVELDMASVWADRRDTGVAAGLALGVPLAAGVAAAALLLGWPGWQGAAAQRWQAMLGIGMACAVTALPILVLFMERLAILRTALGQRILRYASLDDIAIWAVLALVLMDADRMGRQAAFVMIYAAAAWGLRAVMLRLAVRDRWAAALIWLIVAAVAADWAGLHYMVGAFLAGVVIDARWLGRAAVDRLRAGVLLWAMPVFFLSTGLRTEWTMGGGAVIGAAALLLAAAVGGKLLGVALAGRILGWPAGQARLIGWLLQTKALIMIIFANILLDKDIITNAAFTALLLMAVASTMLTIPMVRRQLVAPSPTG